MRTLFKSLPFKLPLVYWDSLIHSFKRHSLIGLELHFYCHITFYYLGYFLSAELKATNA